jgi:hypothetical protein
MAGRESKAEVYGWDLPVNPRDALGYGHLAGDNSAPIRSKLWPMTKAQRLEAYRLLSVAAGSIKDDAKLGAVVREIMRQTWEAQRAHKLEASCEGSTPPAPPPENPPA